MDTESGHANGKTRRGFRCGGRENLRHWRRGSSPGDSTKAVEEYDPATNTWTRRADMLIARKGVCAAAVDGIIYAIGGWDRGADFSVVEAYDPATDRWTRKTSLPTPRSLSVIAVVDGTIYVIGGSPGIKVTSAVEAYNPAADKWTRKADMPTARFELAACVIDGRIYVSGGGTRFGGDHGCVATVEVYDPATDTWAQASDMPRTRVGHSASVVDGKMYIIGGVDFEGHELPSTVDVYDPATDAWTAARERLPSKRVGLTAAVVDGKIYAIGGERGPGQPPLSIVEEYDPGLPVVISSVSPAGKVLETWGQMKKAQ